jgi:predicted PurR-regulated permease PerM
MTLTQYRLVWFAGILLLLGWFLASIQSILFPFIFGMLIAYLFDPAADKLQTMKFSRTAATVTILLIFFSIFALGLVALLPAIARQIGHLFSELPEKINAAQEMLQPYLADIRRRIGVVDLSEQQTEAATISQEVFSAAANLLRGVINSAMNIVNLAALLVIAPVVSFYLLRDWDDIVAKLDRLLPRDYADTIRTQFRAIDTTLSGFIRGQLNVCFILAVFYGLALTIAGLKYSLLISVLAGILIIIPYVGTFVSGVLAVGMAYFQFDDLTNVFVVFGIFVAGQMLEGYVLTPRLVGGSVGLHPMWIILGMMAGGALAGFTGVLIALPVTAVIGVLVRFAIQQYLHSSLYEASQTEQNDNSKA